MKKVEMIQLNAHKVAVNYMDDGFNCCEAVMMTGDKVLDLKLPPEVFHACANFRQGIGSGCVCGALSGMVMLSGILDRRFPHPLGKGLASHLHDRFKEKFGSTCCRVLLKEMSFLDKVGKKGCKEMTGATAVMLQEIWEPVIKAKQLAGKQGAEA